MKAIAWSIDLPEELLEAVRREAREEARRVAAAALAETPKPEAPPPILFMKAAEYAKRRALSKRTVEALIREGLPVVGRGRFRRIPVAAADAWLSARGADTARGQNEAGPRASLAAPREPRRAASK